MKHETLKSWAWPAAVLWTLLIFIGCLWPGKELPDVPVPLIDKWVHFVLFGGFAFLWLYAFRSRSRKALLAAALSGIALGWLIEMLQYLLPALGRSYDAADILADAIGCILGVLLFMALSRKII